MSLFVSLGRYLCRYWRDRGQRTLLLTRITWIPLHSIFLNKHNRFILLSEWPRLPASPLTSEKKIHLQSSTACRYYVTGSCRRASTCRFVHLQPESVPQEYAYSDEHVVHKELCHYYAAGYCQYGSACHFAHSLQESVPQEYAYPAGHDVHTRTQHKSWDQDIGPSHGYPACAIYTVTPRVEPYSFDMRDVFDDYSDISLSDSTSSDQSLNASFQVMTIEEPASSEYQYVPSAFSQLSPSLQYPNNTSTCWGNVAYPGYNRGYTPTNLKPRAATRRKPEQAKEKQIQYRTKPCKFFSTRKTCPNGNRCMFFHDLEKSKRAKKADNQARSTGPSHLPPKPRSLKEEFKARDYYPITWRVIGGGVMMGLPCKAPAAGYCSDGENCKLAHETEVWNTGRVLILCLSLN
ncbi:uncharacterized protein EDB93DRAFT_51324 [Suillus bovinus]|uniref:uncharacterized protein n=1 Tax=Suillus bovinus TaxID=48563 RepID=UPI001B8814A0|nr:uncharacterized protein EDB93DRAFT_51324 [Suillus bovinus]KAG2155776.1 hypothetical protein EDB93DRAFT_51324 [Suillus bovinus]